MRKWNRKSLAISIYSPFTMARLWYNLFSIRIWHKRWPFHFRNLAWFQSQLFAGQSTDEIHEQDESMRDDRVNHYHYIIQFSFCYLQSVCMYKYIAIATDNISLIFCTTKIFHLSYIALLLCSPVNFSFFFCDEQMSFTFFQFLPISFMFHNFLYIFFYLLLHWNEFFHSPFWVFET